MKLPKCATPEADALDSRSIVEQGMDLPANEFRARSAFRAAVAYAESQQDGLDQAGLDLPASKRILKILVLLDLPAPEILCRVESSEFVEELLPELPKVVPKHQLSEYYKCLIGNPEADSFEELRDCDSYKAFESCLVEDFWERRLTERLVHGDERSCWNEVKKAGYDEDLPRGLVERLIGILHSTLCNNGRLKELTKDVVPVQRRHQKLKGFGFACLFCKMEQGKYCFGRTGQMALAIAQYFSTRRPYRRATQIRSTRVEYRSSFVVH